MRLNIQTAILGAFIFIAMFFATGCSTFKSMKSWMGFGPELLVEEAKPQREFTRFSENPQLANPSDRQYRKMNRSRMEEESELHAQAGSMWVMEGQGAYLFAQNKSRREGDLLNVKVEGSGQRQVETKVAVIKKLLKQLEEEELKKNQPPVESSPNLAGTSPEAATPAAPAREPASAQVEKDEPLALDLIPTRIVERTPDGNYRIKGQQPFMIGQREYKVIVTGLVRPEDFNDQGPMSSNNLLDPQFDVVSIRRSQQ
jgi:flagellar L-ring protein precursor FlgH